LRPGIGRWMKLGNKISWKVTSLVVVLKKCCEYGRIGHPTRLDMYSEIERAHLSVCYLTPSSVHPPLSIIAISTPFTWFRMASVGKLYWPGNDFSYG